MATPEKKLISIASLKRGLRIIIPQLMLIVGIDHSIKLPQRGE